MLLFDFLLTSGLLAAAVVVIVCATRFVTKTNTRLDALEARFARLEKGLKTLSNTVQGLQSVLSTKFGASVAQSTSPINLTDYGKEISEKAKADGIATLYADKLKDRVVGMNRYEIQEHCFSYAKNDLLKDLKENAPEEYKVITDYAYDAGLEAKKITYVIGIKLRDALLHSMEMTPNEPDKRNPSA